MRNLPELLRAAERRVNAHLWPNRADNLGADSHLASIPANRNTDTDLLLIEAADRIAQLEAALLRAKQELALWDHYCTGKHGSQSPCHVTPEISLGSVPETVKEYDPGPPDCPHGYWKAHCAICRQSETPAKLEWHTVHCDAYGIGGSPNGKPCTCGYESKTSAETSEQQQVCGKQAPENWPTQAKIKGVE